MLIMRYSIERISNKIDQALQGAKIFAFASQLPPDLTGEKEGIFETV
ncbi:MAG: hypothetical protein GPJ00_21040 [Microcystis aeruginosa W13-18]|jgi:hypothetical protein|nr:hypothetical protein [Microcystis aeruginosa W13-18]NCR51242.1 hypothetical protein [Microcystis aeruginosa S11-01]NCS50073.1 hypothetical protein [Microcystis aeruginosa BK11-02]NCS78813.1 hypothetical protein [Microcystis aeruginosa K13-07]